MFYVNTCTWDLEAIEDIWWKSPTNCWSRRLWKKTTTLDMRRGGSVRCENPDKKHNYKVEPDS